MFRIGDRKMITIVISNSNYLIEVLLSLICMDHNRMKISSSDLLILVLEHPNLLISLQNHSMYQHFSTSRILKSIH